MKEKVVTLDAAYRRFCVPSIESKGYMIENVRDVNKGRHKYIMCNGVRFCFIYKRAFFGTYSQQFQEEGVGESINVDRLFWCIDHHVDFILIGYPDGKIYAVNPNDWKQYCDSHGTYRKVIKVEYDKNWGKKVERKEATASIPINIMKRWN